MQKPILILGGGHMGGALGVRWHTARLAPIHVVEPNIERRHSLAEFGITTHADMTGAPNDTSAVVLAIKPQLFGELSKLLVNVAPRGTLISIMAGIPLAALQHISRHTVRVMPNLPAQIGESMSVACAPELASTEREFVTQLFAAAGSVAWVEDEELLHAVTAISGSGPAYVFAFMEALVHAATKQGLPPAIARQLVNQTLRGAALLADQSAEDAATLRRNVTSPGGTTEAALKIFTQGNFSALIADAIASATGRSRELST